MGRESGKDSLVNSTRLCLQVDCVAQLRGHGMYEYGIVVDSIGGHGPLLRLLLLLLLLLWPRRFGPTRKVDTLNSRQLGRMTCTNLCVAAGRFLRFCIVPCALPSLLTTCVGRISALLLECRVATSCGWLDCSTNSHGDRKYTLGPGTGTAKAIEKWCSRSFHSQKNVDSCTNRLPSIAILQSPCSYGDQLERVLRIES